MITFELLITSDEFDIYDDNVDVEISLDGDVYYATFFTLTNIKSLFKKNRNTGECRSGLYLWASDMILVETLSKDVIQHTVEDLITSGELYIACSKQEKGSKELIQGQSSMIK